MHKRVVLPALALSGALLLAGCSAAAPATPKQAVSDAVTKTGSGKDSSVSFKLDTTADDLTKLVTAASSSESAQSKQQLAVITKIVPKLAMKAAVHSNGADLNTEKSPDKLDGSFSVSVDGKPAEFLWIGAQPYLHADVEGIGQATGLFTSTQVKMLTDSAATQFPWINDVVDGKWVTLDKATAAKFVEKATAQAATASPTASPSYDPAKIRDGVLESSEITKVDDKTYKVVTDAKKLLKAAASFSSTDNYDDAEADKAIADLNDGAKLNSTVTVADGKVSRVVVDLANVIRTWPKAQADQPEIAKLAATDFKLDGVVDLDGSDQKIAAPQAATTIPASDAEKLLNS